VKELWRLTSVCIGVRFGDVRSLAMHRLRHAFFVSSIATVLALTGCGTPRPPPSPYALTPGGIGVSAIPQEPAAEEGAVPPTTMPDTVNRTHESTSDSSWGIPKGWGYFGPGALLLVPFAYAEDAVRSAVQAQVRAYDAERNAAQLAKCDAKLNSAYPEASAKFRGILQRELILQDIEEQFVATFQRRSIADVVAVPSPVGPRDIPDTQQLLNAAAHRGVAHVLIIEVLSADLAPSDVDCEQWTFRVRLRVSVWNIADGKRIGGPLFTFANVNVGLNALRAVMEEAGALRTRLAPSFGIAADDIIDQRQFVLPR
jgi:hypothetical protein